MLQIGQLLYGYCGGAFGRDSYFNKRIEAMGIDWVVARDEYGDLHIATGENVQDRLAKYTVRPKEDEDF